MAISNQACSSRSIHDWMVFAEYSYREFSMVYISHIFFLVTCTIRWVHWPKEYLEISQMFLEPVSYDLHMMLEGEGIALSFWNKSLIPKKHGKHKGCKKHGLHMSHMSRWTPISLAVYVNSNRIYPTPLDTYHHHAQCPADSLNTQPHAEKTCPYLNGA